MGLREKVFSGLRYSALTKFFETSFSFVLAIIMARLLGPEVFGLIAMVVVFTGINELFVNFGTEDAIIRHKRSDRSFLSSIFWLNTAVGIVVFSILLLSGELIANFYGYPILRWIVYLMATKVIFSAMSIVPRGILMRKMNFKAIFFQKIIVVPTSGIIAIVLALNGFGVWSLVTHQIITVVFSAAIVWVLANWVPRLSFDIRHIKEIFSFSSYLSLAKFANYFTKKGDLFLIGKFLGATPLGFYAKGYGLLVRPLKLINGIILPVLFPAISEIQHDTRQLRLIYLQCSQIMALIYFPILVGSIFLAEPFVLLLLGEKWAAIIPLVPIFTTMLIFISQSSIASHYLKALGKTRKLFVIMMLSSVVTIVSFVIGLQWGIVGVARGYCLSILFQYILFTIVASSLIKLAIGKILINLKIVFFSSLAMSLGIFLSLWFMYYLEITSHLLTFIGGGSLGLICYLGFLHFHPIEANQLFREFLLQRKVKIAIS